MAEPLGRTSLWVVLICGGISAGVTLLAGANPLDPTVAAGHAVFTSTANTLRVENTPGTIIDWGSFSIGAGELTHFQQQSAASQVLNRVTGQDPSSILGRLTSNGQVFLINPNGIAFGRDAVVDVAGLVISTLGISNADFLAGRLSFSGASAGSIRNDGTLQAASGGRVFVVAPTIENNGLIATPGGTVLLAGGHSVTLVDSNRPDVQVQLSTGSDESVDVGRIVGSHVGIYGALVRLNSSINALGAVLAVDGTVVLTAGNITPTSSGATLSIGSGATISTSGQSGGSGLVLSNSGNVSFGNSGVLTGGGRITINDAGGSVRGGVATVAGGSVQGGGVTVSSQPAPVGGATPSRRPSSTAAAGAGQAITAQLDPTGANVAAADRAARVLFPRVPSWAEGDLLIPRPR